MNHIVACLAQSFQDDHEVGWQRKVACKIFPAATSYRVMHLRQCKDVFLTHPNTYVCYKNDTYTKAVTLIYMNISDWWWWGFQSPRLIYRSCQTTNWLCLLLETNIRRLNFIWNKIECQCRNLTALLRLEQQ